MTGKKDRKLQEMLKSSVVNKRKPGLGYNLFKSEIHVKKV